MIMETIEHFAVDDQKRLEGVGGSEIGTVLGVNTFCSNVELYLIKRGELIDDVDTDSAELGHILEPWILNKYEAKEKIKLDRPGDRVYRHPEHNWIFGHVDGLVIGEKRGVDAKSTGLMNFRAAMGFGKTGTDQVPLSIIAQCAIYMAIMDYSRWDVAALVAGGGVRFYQINRDLDLERSIINRLKTFWFDHVKKGIPPAPKSVKDVELIYSNGDLGKIECKPQIYQAYLDILKAKRNCAKANEAKEVNEMIIKEYMADHGSLVDFTDKILVTWFKDNDNDKFDKKAFEKAEPELYKKYSKSKVGGRRFLVKKVSD